MFWYLLLSHFIADYPLQTTWMVRNKDRFWVLFLHCSIHFVTMMVVTLPVTIRIWPYLLALAAIHFVIDSGKNWFNLHRPKWRIASYLIDQLIHILSVGLVSLWVITTIPPTRPLLSVQAAVVLTGFLLVTYVYLISERVLMGSRPDYLGGSNIQVWTRLVSRAALLGLLLLGWNLRPAPASGLALVAPYPAGRAGLRILLTDLLVTLLTALLVVLATGSAV